jgi:hypothetical protein
MAYDVLRTMLLLLEVFRPALTRPGFANLLVVFTGWVRTSGTHAVTQTLVETSVAGRRHHEAFHRFFSRGTWSPDELSQLLFGWLLRSLPASATIRIVLDDTVAPKKGRNIFGLGTHLDAVRSTRKHRIFIFGHCWVVLAVLVHVPFSRRVWALPLLLRLYRNEKECLKKGIAHRKKTVLAREMLDLFVGWVGDRRVELAADSAYCNDTVFRDLSPSVIVFGAMRPDAVLTEPTVRRVPSPKGGRPRVRGALLPKPHKLAVDERVPWQTTTLCLYGRQQAVSYKTLVAQWYRACGTRRLRVVVVQMESEIRVFFSTDSTHSVGQILQGYAGRWNIEVCFRELKQLLGFADSSARKRAAVERIAPFVALIYSTIVVWFAQGVYRTPYALPPLRPWYRHKHGFSFADVLRAAQRALAPLDVLDPHRSLANLRKRSMRTASPSPFPVSTAA